MNKLGILDKVMFWKKKETPLGAEPGLGMEPGLPKGEMPMEPGLPGEDNLGLRQGTGLPGETPTMEHSPMPSSPSPMPTSSLSALEEQQQFTQSSTVAKDMEIISAKLDSIRATLENVNQRIAHLEKIASESEHETVQQRQW